MITSFATDFPQDIIGYFFKSAMVFHISYRRIQNYNMQHIHSAEHLPHKTRRPFHKPRRPNLLSDLFVTMELDQQNNPTKSRHHPAPAFRDFSSDDVEDIVDRLYKTPCPQKTLSLPNIHVKRPYLMSKDEQVTLNARLLQPTVAAKIRLATLGLNQTEKIPESIQNTCERYNKAPSSRYHPNCYENITQHNFSYRYWNGSTNTF